MEIFLNSADPKTVERYLEIYPLDGVTSNQKMIGLLGKTSYADTIKGLRNACKEKKLFTQVVSKDYSGMIKEAEYICELAGKENTVVKLPSNEVGIQALKTLHNRGFKTCGTLVFSTIQAVMMLAAGADYVAVFYSYMVNLGLNPDKALEEIQGYIDKSGCKGKLIGAGFRNIDQIGTGIKLSPQAININPDSLTEWMHNLPSVDTTRNFIEGWEKTWGKGTTILDTIKMKSL